MKITTKGQVTIPIDIREELGLLPHTEVEFEVDDGEVRMRKVDNGRRGRRLVEQMRGRADTGLSTEQILSLTRNDQE